MIVAATGASAQYQRKMTTTIVEQPDFYKSPEREHTQNDSFQQIYSVKKLPTAIRDYLGKMANPRERWQDGCVLLSPIAPDKRLIFAALSDDHLIVYYETGGYSGALRFDIFSFKQDLSFNAKSFESPGLNPFFIQRRVCFGQCEFTPIVVRAENVIHRGSGYTSKRLETIDELKAAILASRSD